MITGNNILKDNTTLYAYIDALRSFFVYILFRIFKVVQNAVSVVVEVSS